MTRTLKANPVVQSSSFSLRSAVANSNDEAVARKTLNVRNVKTIVVANTSAPQATCATVIPTIGFNGCGSFGDATLVM